jgi:putative thioredoxin
MSTVFSGAADQAPQGGADLIIDTTTQAFAKDVLDASRKQPVLVDFWAPWCGPCKTLSPIIERAVRAAKGAVKLVKMNIDDHPAVAGQLGIQSIPAVIAFVNGQPVDGFIGAVPESQVKAFIERVSGPPKSSGAAEIIAEAEKLLAAGDASGAAELFAQALKIEPQSIPAVAGLASCFVATGELEGARQTLSMLPDSAQNDPRVKAVRAKLDLASQTEDLGDVAALEARLGQNPNDHQARFDLALLANARGDRQAAVDRLLEILQKDRSWQEEKARKQLLQLFEAWGPADEATLSGRRRLSSMLFA